MTQVEWFEDDGEADLLRELDRLVRGFRDVAVWDGQANGFEHALRLVLVLRDLYGDSARMIGERRLDASQVAAEPELNE